MYILGNNLFQAGDTFYMISQLAWKVSNSHCHQTMPSEIWGLINSCATYSKFCSSFSLGLWSTAAEERRLHATPPWRGFFPNSQSMFFTDLQQIQSCDSRRELILINRARGWGKMCSFVTQEFWGVPLSQNQCCESHKYLYHAALPSTKTCMIFLSFKSLFSSSQKVLQILPIPIKASY